MSDRRPHKIPADPQAFARLLVPHVTVRELASALARISRFAGNTGGVFYSVAQHSVIVADEVMRITRDPLQALCAQAHDAHEYRINDILTFVAEWLTLQTGRDCLAELKTALDARIYPLLGLPWPLQPAVMMAIAETDARALATELRDVGDAFPLRTKDLAVPFANPISQCWAWPKAEEQFLLTWNRYALAAGLGEET